MNRRQLNKSLIGIGLCGQNLGCDKVRLSQETYKPRVVIIGAGIAGLAAAKELISNGFEVVVLDARKYVGGRINTSHKWNHTPIDLGASWIHGVKNNPITKIADIASMKRIPTYYEKSIAYNKNGKILTELEEISLENHKKAFLNGIREFQQSSNDLSIDNALKSIAENNKNLNIDYLHFIASSLLEQEYAGDTTQISTLWYDETKIFDGDDVIFKDGFSLIPNSLSANIKIELNTKVTKINYIGKLIEVFTENKKWICEHVIVTVPLGVLKNKSIEFEPPLDTKKLQAIEAIGMGPLNKCYLLFEKAFWPEDIDWIEYTGDKAKAWTEWVSFKRAINVPILLGFNAGNSARNIEKLSDQETVESAMKILRKIYGNDTKDPIDYQITRWASDEYSYGSYSFNALGSLPEHRDDLASNIDGRVFFAGEATNREYFGTVHGAYLSGIRAANEIIEELK